MMQTQVTPTLPQDRRTPIAERKCSFCGKASERIERLIAGPGGIHICNECVDLFGQMIAEHRAKDVAR